MKAFLLIPALVSAAILLAAADDESGIRMWLRLRSDLEASGERIAGLQAEIAGLRVEVRDLETDPFALERAIREDLRLARPGETVVRFIELDSESISRLP